MSRRRFVQSAAAAASASLLLGGATGTALAQEGGSGPFTVRSPDSRIGVTFRLVNGSPVYSVTRDARPVIEPSAMGFALDGDLALDRGFEVTGGRRSSTDDSWKPVWGASSSIRDHHNELAVQLRRTTAPHAQLDIVFRVFDDGVGFRYVFPAQDALTDLVIMEERTEFRFADDHLAWSIPANYDSYEYLHNESRISGVGALAPGDVPKDFGTEVPGAAATPLTVKAADDLYVALHEAALVDFAEMTLIPSGSSLRSALVPLKGQGGVKVRTKAPRPTPWRTLIIGDSPGALIESPLVLNLNEPCALQDTSWIQPGKYVGIWWSVHKGMHTWAPGEDLGATTENAKEYIDFAAANGIPYVLAEGWNVGWAKDETQNFLKPNAQFDLDEVLAYGKSKGVGFLGHNETTGDVANYERQIDEAFAMYGRLGLPGVKTGYAGNIADHHHHDQWMVNHYQRVIDKAAEHRLMIDAHEPIKSTGLERTYPHFMTREGTRGLEWEAWSSGNPASHTTTIPFTRMLAGPVDYTPGIFNITWHPEQAPGDVFGEANDNSRVHTTRAHQMALYPVLLSGLQMLADVPENYRDQPEFEFLKQVPATWDETKVLNGRIGDYVTIARRSGKEWYVGSLTDENARTLDVPLTFLGAGQYVAHIYGDGPETDYATNPNAVRIQRSLVTSADTVRAAMAASGGQAIRLVPATASDVRQLKAYVG